MFVNLEDFKNEWLKDIQVEDLNEKRLLFSRKILSDWLDVDPNSENFIEFNGENPIVDIAYLHEEQNDDDTIKTWYLIKYSSIENLIVDINIKNNEIDKLYDLLTTQVIGNEYKEFNEIGEFVVKTNEHNKISLIYCSDQTYTDDAINKISEIQKRGRKRISPFFYTDFINIEIIFERILSQERDSIKNSFEFKANLNQAGKLYVGSIPLKKLFDFMKDYEKRTNDIDRLYEKNVRQYLGSRRQVNKGIKRTILLSPSNFGLFNNGITIVTSEISNKQTNSIVLIDPFIVNGAQTTKTLWETFDSGCIEKEEVWLNLVKKIIQQENPKPLMPTHEEWLKELQYALVVVKIVQTENDYQAIRDITKYTNSQTAVTAKDFLAVNDNFNDWQRKMSDTYKIYLEIQRGGWTSQKAKQSINPHTSPYFKDNEWINAFDLIKVFAAGWLGEVGSAFGKTPPFSPGGTIFNKIINKQTHEDGEKTIHIDFSLNDLYACYLLHQKTLLDYKFGRTAEHDKKNQRGSTRYLYYYTVIKIIKDVLLNSLGVNKPYFSKNVTTAFLSLFEPANKFALTILMDTASQIVDDYFTEGMTDNVFQDPQFKNFENNLNQILKSPSIGKTNSFNTIFAVTVRAMKFFSKDGISPYSEITNIIKKQNYE